MEKKRREDGVHSLRVAEGLVVEGNRGKNEVRDHRDGGGVKAIIFGGLGDEVDRSPSG